MATKALTAVAPRASRNHVSASKAPAHGSDWREILIKQEAQAIWQKLLWLVRSSIREDPDKHDSITQDIFLFLMSTDRFSLYIERGFSDEEIKLDIISLLTS
ncbi:MAG: hypothetical protein WBV94_17995 [Blastocatellia bacterium]